MRLKKKWFSFILFFQNPFRLFLTCQSWNSCLRSKSQFIQMCSIRRLKGRFLSRMDTFTLDCKSNTTIDVTRLYGPAICCKKLKHLQWPNSQNKAAHSVEMPFELLLERKSSRCQFRFRLYTLNWAQFTTLTEDRKPGVLEILTG